MLTFPHNIPLEYVVYHNCLNWTMVNPLTQDTRFAEHDNIDNRRLLWHGTNIAVVAAILKDGLRIMPHSGGRVGRGIYFASEHSKSAGYGKCYVGCKVFWICLFDVTIDIERDYSCQPLRLSTMGKIWGGNRQCSEIHRKHRKCVRELYRVSLSVSQWKPYVHWTRSLSM